MQEIPTHKSPLGERFRWLLTHFGKRVEDVAQATGISKSYLYYLAKGEREEPSYAKLEQIAGFFGISPLFFSRDPGNWVPPVRREEIQYALRTAGQLDDCDLATLEQLIQEVKQLEEKKRDGK